MSNKNAARRQLPPRRFGQRRRSRVRQPRLRRWTPLRLGLCEENPLARPHAVEDGGGEELVEEREDKSAPMAFSQ